MANEYQTDKGKLLTWLLGFVVAILMAVTSKILVLTSQHDIAIAKIETWQEAFEKQRSEADRIRTETDRDLKTRVSKIEDGINEILKYQRNKP
jgi:hypothetical protein